MNLLETRFQKRLTQWTLARTLGVHQSRISLIENGIVTPTESEKEALARGLGVKVEEIDWPQIKDQGAKNIRRGGTMKQFYDLAEKFPSAVLDRLSIERATGGIVTVSQLAEADSIGAGPRGGFRMRGRPAYRAAAIVDWLEERKSEETSEE
jgi:transcriptional regulator with XRE-family HTH domain